MNKNTEEKVEAIIRDNQALQEENRLLWKRLISKGNEPRVDEPKSSDGKAANPRNLKVDFNLEAETTPADGDKGETPYFWDSEAGRLHQESKERERETMRRLESLEEYITRCLGMPPPERKIARESYATSPFVKWIAEAKTPARFFPPTFVLYEGMDDPEDHITLYKQKMLTTSIPADLREACMCRNFGSSFTGPDLRWFVSLPRDSIGSFADLHQAFCRQFSNYRKIRKQHDA